MKHAVCPGESRFQGGDLPLAVLKLLYRRERRALASLLLTRRVELDAVARVLVGERLGVYAYAATESLALGGMWPRQVLARLRDQWTGQQQRNADLLAALDTIDTAFGGAGIEYLVLKGLPLSDRFHGGIDRRFTWDLDLLVHESDVASGMQILAAIGVAAPSYTSGLHRLARRVTHAMECRRTDGLSVDLHWAFRRLPGLRFPADDVFRNHKLHDLGCHSYRVPADEHVLVQVLLGIAADVDRSLCRMRSLWDAYLLLGALPASGWTAFLARRETEGCLRLVANAIALVVHRMDAADEFPELLHALRTCRNGLTVHEPDRAMAILTRPPHAFRNHLEYASWQPQPPWRYWAWWAVTLPARSFFARRL